MEMEITHDIKVSVDTFFHEENENSGRNRFIHVYNITIENLSQDKVQLLRRTWLINDGIYGKREVKGEGVVGKKPIINPGETYTYQSWCPLYSTVGKMEGSYLMRNLNSNQLFNIKVPSFVMVYPFAMN